MDAGEDGEDSSGGSSDEEGGRAVAARAARRVQRQKSADATFIVERVVAHRVRLGKTEYLIKWTGLPSKVRVRLFCLWVL